MAEMPEACVRLACSDCNREDFDGITPCDLELLTKTWEDIDEYQSWEESNETFDDRAYEPPGYSILDWYTHIGLCPDCKEAMNGRYAMRALFPETD